MFSSDDLAEFPAFGKKFYIKKHILKKSKFLWATYNRFHESTNKEINFVDDPYIETEDDLRNVISILGGKIRESALGIDFINYMIIDDYVPKTALSEKVNILQERINSDINKALPIVKAHSCKIIRDAANHFIVIRGVLSFIVNITLAILKTITGITTGYFLFSLAMFGLLAPMNFIPRYEPSFNGTMAKIRGLNASDCEYDHQLHSILSKYKTECDFANDTVREYSEWRCGVFRNTYILSMSFAYAFGQTDIFIISLSELSFIGSDAIAYLIYILKRITVDTTTLILGPFLKEFMIFGMQGSMALSMSIIGCCITYTVDFTIFVVTSIIY